MVKKELLILGGVYGAVGVTFALLARTASMPRDAASAFLAVLWLGFVLAISFTEAWIKFHAPFVPRHLVLDVGRTVFAALNAVELALCAGLWLVQLFGTAQVSSSDISGVLVALTVVIGAQFALLYPRLELRAQFALYDALKNQPDESLNGQSLTVRQRELFDQMHHNVEVRAQPPAVLHVVYVLGEVAKVVLLSVFSLRILNRLPN